MTCKTKYTNFYLAITIEPIEGKYYAYVERISDGDDLVWVINRINHVLHVNIMPTKKKANEVVDCWNNSYRRNGTYLLDDEEYRKNPTKYY